MRALSVAPMQFCAIASSYTTDIELKKNDAEHNVSPTSSQKSMSGMHTNEYGSIPTAIFQLFRIQLSRRLLLDPNFLNQANVSSKIMPFTSKGAVEFVSIDCIID